MTTNLGQTSLVIHPVRIFNQDECHVVEDAMTEKEVWGEEGSGEVPMDESGVTIPEDG